MFIGLLASAYISKHVYSMVIYQALTPYVPFRRASLFKPLTSLIQSDPAHICFRCK